MIVLSTRSAKGLKTGADLVDYLTAVGGEDEFTFDDSAKARAFRVQLGRMIEQLPLYRQPGIQIRGHYVRVWIPTQTSMFPKRSH